MAAGAFFPDLLDQVLAAHRVGAARMGLQDPELLAGRLQLTSDPGRRPVVWVAKPSSTAGIEFPGQVHRPYGRRDSSPAVPFIWILPRAVPHRATLTADDASPHRRPQRSFA
ncbi:hypothetical protein [Streptomyces sp. NPDC056682]|uniref:hypothetical protein n=1 Tax=Streptomyces sp. NPDC056682 TaxID=3345909 RepID=UPI0036B139C2